MNRPPRAWGLLAGACVACAAEPASTLRVDGIAPGTAPAGVATPVFIDGEFPVVTRVSFDTGAEVNSAFEAGLGGTAIEGVTLAAAGRLTGLVPGTLPPGRYDLEVRGPDGAAVALPAAFEVLPALALDDSHALDEDTTLQVAAPGVLANDSDPGGTMLTAELVRDVAWGVLDLQADGSFDYTPEPERAGVVTFEYRAVTSVGASGPATVTLTVDPVNDPPNVVVAPGPPLPPATLADYRVELGNTLSGVAFTVTDADLASLSGGATLTVSATSSDPAVLSVAGIAITYDPMVDPQSGTIALTPVATGVATVTVTVNDTVTTSADAFDVAVVARAVVAPGSQFFDADFQPAGMISRWVHSWLGSAARQSGAFTVQFDVVADVLQNGDAGICLSDGTDQDMNDFSWTDFGVLVRFNNGRIQARRSDAYCPEGPSPPCDGVSAAPVYNTGDTYRLRLEIGFPNLLYSAYATNLTTGGAEEVIGESYDFRADWREGPGQFDTALGLSAWSAWPDNGIGASGVLEVIDFTVIGQ